MANMKRESSAAIEQVPELVQNASSAPDRCRDCRTCDAHFRKRAEPEDQAGIEDNIQTIGEPQRSKRNSGVGTTSSPD